MPHGGPAGSSTGQGQGDQCLTAAAGNGGVDLSARFAVTGGGQAGPGVGHLERPGFQAPEQRAGLFMVLDRFKHKRQVGAVDQSNGRVHGFCGWVVVVRRDRLRAPAGPLPWLVMTGGVRLSDPPVAK